MILWILRDGTSVKVRIFSKTKLVLLHSTGDSSSIPLKKRKKRHFERWFIYYSATEKLTHKWLNDLYFQECQGFDVRKTCLLNVRKIFVTQKLAIISMQNCTVCTFQDFSVTQILREINFDQSWRSKTALFAILRGSECFHFGQCQPLKIAKIPKNLNSEPQNMW